MQEIIAHKKNIREIADQPAKINNVAGLGLDISLIALAIATSVALQSTWIYTLSVFLIGSRMRGLMNLLHECSHNSLVISNVHLNNLLGQMCALSLLMTREGYTESHMRHHLYFRDENKDPDLIRYRAVFGDIAVRGAKSLDEWVGGILNIRNFVLYAYINSTRDVLVSGRRNLLVLLGFWGAIVTIFIYFGKLDLLFLYWIIPYYTTFKVVCYIAELAEHFGIYAKANELEQTRNMYVNKVAEFLFWPHGDNYHLVHHLFPFVPGFHLSQVNSYLQLHCSNYALLRSTPLLAEPSVK